MTVGLVAALVYVGIMALMIDARRAIARCCAGASCAVIERKTGTAPGGSTYPYSEAFKRNAIHARETVTGFFGIPTTYQPGPAGLLAERAFAWGSVGRSDGVVQVEIERSGVALTPAGKPRSWGLAVGGGSALDAAKAARFALAAWAEVPLRCVRYRRWRLLAASVAAEPPCQHAWT